MPVLEKSIDFVLPGELEAHEPAEARGLRRDQVRMLVSYRDTDAVTHAHFSDLPELLDPRDLVVVNDSGTLPAELTARSSDDSSLTLRVSTRLPSGLWAVEPRDTVVRAGQVLSLPGGGTARLEEPYRGSARLWTAHLVLPIPLTNYLLRWGRPIRYPYVPQPWPLDTYQTVYHGELGSAEMPSAGRPFTRATIARLRQRDIGFAKLTLHTGVSSLESHEAPYEEFYRVPADTAHAVQRAREDGGRVIAVGTTVVRALESAADATRVVHAGEEWTDLVITPARGVRAVDSLLTGFHEPQATHLAMLEAIAGHDHVMQAYQAALAEGYLWHEFGDVHLIL